MFVYCVTPTLLALNLAFDGIKRRKYKSMGLWMGEIIGICENGLIMLKMDRNSEIVAFHPDSLKVVKV